MQCVVVGVQNIQVPGGGPKVASGTPYPKICHQYVAMMPNARAFLQTAYVTIAAFSCDWIYSAPSLNLPDATRGIPISKSTDPTNTPL